MQNVETEVDNNKIENKITEIQSKEFLQSKEMALLYKYGILEVSKMSIKITHTPR